MKTIKYFLATLIIFTSFSVSFPANANTAYAKPLAAYAMQNHFEYEYINGVLHIVWYDNDGRVLYSEPVESD